MPTLKNMLLTLKDYARALVAPARSFTSYLLGIQHHKKTDLPDKKAQLNHPSVKHSRNIYLTDLDDTFINWRVAHRSTLWKLHHRLLHRPTSESIEIFDHAENFIEKLNKSDVHTAIVSNKEHKKLLSQAKHHDWGGKFDRLFGHDRQRAITLAKMPNTIIPKVARYHRTDYPLYIIETLLNEKLSKGMEPVNVIFVGDKITQDVGTANLLDKALKKLNPESSCTSVLFNSRLYEESKVSSLPTAKKPKFIVHNYNELESVADIVYARGKKEAKTSELQETEKPARPKKMWAERVEAIQEKEKLSAGSLAVQ